MKNNHNQLLIITTTAAMIALTCVLTMAVRIPTPTKGYLNLGDCAVLFSGWLLGPVYGAIAGGVGSAMADLLAGYPAYVPGTLLIKALMALIISFAPYRLCRNDRKHSGIGFLICAVIAGALMVSGYWLYEAVVIGEGYAAALAGVSGNVFQGLAGIAGSYFLVEVLSRTGSPGTYGVGGFAKGATNESNDLSAGKTGG